MTELLDEDESRGDRDNDEDLPSPNPQGFVRSALVFYGVMGCVALVWRMATPGESILYPGTLASGSVEASSLSFAVGAGIVMGLIAVGLGELFTRWTGIGERLTEVLAESFAGIGTGDAILLALASGTAEEMLFRGALQPAVGLFWASLVFGACHFVPRRELAVWSLYAVAMGFGLGWLYQWTGHLLAPIVAHTVVNGINLPRLARHGENSTDE